MSTNKKAKDYLNDKLNPYFKTHINPNWKALIEAIGESDQDVADLVEEVRKQFFINTSNRPYIDKLASNLKINRPKVVGMDDETMRRYIPILAYKPKQVKIVLDQLLDIFFFKESTTAFIQSTTADYFNLKDGWELTYLIDNNNIEEIFFKSEDFTDISNAGVDEIVAIINRQAKYSFAVAFDNRIEKKKFIRIFTKTIGSKGSVEIVGGRANISINFPGFIEAAGSGSNTRWSFSKIGESVTLSYIDGYSPNLYLVNAGDVVVLDMPENTKNSGSFVISDVDLSNNSIRFTNLLSQDGIFDHSLNNDYFVRFFTPKKSVIYTKDNRSVVWETSPGEIVIEMPSTPPVVRRVLKGSAHVNGNVATMTNRISQTSIEIDDASDWPSSGKFVIEPIEEIKSHIKTSTEDFISLKTIDGRFDSYSTFFKYTGKNQNTLTGIEPNIPELSGVFEFNISSIIRNSSDIVTVTTTNSHNFIENQSICIYDVQSGSGFNGTWNIYDVTANSFKYKSFGSVESSNGGTARGEAIKLSNSGSRIYLTSAVINTGIIGPVVWDTGSSFVLSAYTGKTAMNIKAGSVVLNLSIDSSNSIPNEQGYLIFDYGLETQEGPVRYLYKYSDSTIALDPAYVFQYDHDQNSGIVAIRRKGAQILGGLGREYAFYASDPGAALDVLKDLISKVKSVGVYLRYIIRYPNVAYSEYDIYNES
jgi:hypothetical protein